MRVLIILGIVVGMLGTATIASVADPVPGSPLQLASALAQESEEKKDEKPEEAEEEQKERHEKKKRGEEERSTSSSSGSSFDCRVTLPMTQMTRTSNPGHLK